MPTYRMLTDGLGTQWIDFITPTNASEVPVIDLDSYTDAQTGTLTDADREGLRMLAIISNLPDGTRPPVTDYRDWGKVILSFNPLVTSSITRSGVGTATQTVATSITTTAITSIETILSGLGLNYSVYGVNEVFTDISDLAIEAGPLTFGEFPSDWSAATLVP